MFTLLLLIVAVRLQLTSPHNPNFKQAGLFGGLAVGSTIVYYQYITELLEPYAEKFQYPEIIIYSSNWVEIKDLIYENPPEWDKVVDIFVDKFNEMVTMGADFGAVLCNTVHEKFDEIQERVKMPLLSIVNATLTEMIQVGYKKAILFGTKSTITMGYYQRSFAGKIDMIVPSAEDVDYIDNKIFTELMRGIFTNETRQHFISIIEKNKIYGIDSVVIGCTEISILLPGKQYVGVETADSTHIHAKAIAEYSKNF